MTRSFLGRYRPGGRLNDPGQMELNMEFFRSSGSEDEFVEKTENGATEPVVSEEDAMSGLAEFLAALKTSVARERINLDDLEFSKRWLGSLIAASRNMPEDVLFSVNVCVSPEVALYILDTYNKPFVLYNDDNEGEEFRNRGVRQGKLREIRRIIQEGRWQVLAQGVSFSRDGRLNNGQHRLLAMSELRVSLNMYFTFGEGREAFHAIDTPGVRSGSDMLTIMGYKYGPTITAAVRTLKALQAEGPVVTGSLWNEEVLAFVKQNPILEDFAANGTRLNKEINALPGAVVAALYLIDRDTAHPERLSRFIRCLETGEDIGSRDRAIVKLRKALSARELDEDVKHDQNKPFVQCAAIIKTWNLYIGRKAGMPNELKWKFGEDFPVAE